MVNQIKNVVDHTALLAAFSSVIGLLQGILAILASAAALVWSCIRIYEWWKTKKNGPK